MYAFSLDCGLQTEYKDYEVKKIVRLALVPLNRLDEGWMETDSISSSPEHPSHSKLSTLNQDFIYT